MALKDKDLSLSQREANGLKEDNERISRMYELMQNEAFNNIDKLKKNTPIVTGDQSTDKKPTNYNYNKLKDDKKAQPPANAVNGGKKTKNGWRVCGDNFGSSRDDFSNSNPKISGFDEGDSKDNHVTMKRYA
jgi:hypothetical protein